MVDPMKVEESVEPKSFPFLLVRKVEEQLSENSKTDTDFIIPKYKPPNRSLLFCLGIRNYVTKPFMATFHYARGLGILYNVARQPFVGLHQQILQLNDYESLHLQNTRDKFVVAKAIDASVHPNHNGVCLGHSASPSPLFAANKIPASLPCLCSNRTVKMPVASIMFKANKSPTSKPCLSSLRTANGQLSTSGLNPGWQPC